MDHRPKGTVGLAQANTIHQFFQALINSNSLFKLKTKRTGHKISSDKPPLGDNDNYTSAERIIEKPYPLLVEV